MGKISHDSTVYRNYQQQMKSAESAAYHERLAYQLGRARHADKTIRHLFGDAKTNNQYIKLSDTKKTTDVIHEVQEFIGRAAQLRNTSKENVTIVCFLNWASMRRTYGPRASSWTPS